MRKRAGKLRELEAVLVEDPPGPGTTAIGHTRWATHGAPTDANAHPHLDCTGRIAVIHNGIVENHQELRAGLEKEGHVFASDTDTEVIAHLIEGGARRRPHRRGARGGRQPPGRLRARRVRRRPPGGAGRRQGRLAARRRARHRRDPARLRHPGRARAHALRGAARRGRDRDDLGRRRRGHDPRGRAGRRRAAHGRLGRHGRRSAAATTGSCARRSTSSRPRSATRSSGARRAGASQLDELRVPDDVLREVSKVFVVACGTAFHSGLVAKYAIEHWTRVPVEIEIASEFRYRDPVLGPDTLTLAVSQSGETIDTLEAARHARRQGSQVIAVTNTVGSSITREADAVLYTHAGPEIGVASTKTFATQMVAQQLVALYLAQVRGAKYPEEIARLLEELSALPGAGRTGDRARRPRPHDRRTLRRGARLALHRAAHGVSRGARGRPQAEGALVRARVGLSGRRAQARADRAGRAGRAGRGDRHPVPRLSRRCCRTSRR